MILLVMCIAKEHKSVLFVFLRGKTSTVCGPHLQTSVEEEVNQTSTVCKKKVVWFLTYVVFQNKLVVVYERRWWVVVVLDGDGGR
ncbi:hypothetical protein Hanom_Chr11g01037521 [Helianthus anomalus]